MKVTGIESFANSNLNLDQVSEEIVKLSAELDSARVSWLTAKAEYENDYARCLLESKAKDQNLVQEEIKAMARVKSHETRMKSIIAQSNYQRILVTLHALRDRLESLREISYNLREERRGL